MMEICAMITDRIDRARFDNYLALLHSIARKQEELAAVEAKLSRPGSVRHDGMPKSTHINLDKTAFLVQEKISIENDLKKLEDYTKNERQELFNAIRELENPLNLKKLFRDKELLISEASVLRLRYLCGLGWTEINDTFHGAQEDYEENKEKYIRKVFKYHGNAFIDLQKIFK